MSILTRYVIGQVLRSFLLALVTITAIFVLFMVMAEASRAGLAPGEILRIVPYIIPSSLPYTVPVALLFAVSVAYGRMASDNEVIAVKTAGLNPVRTVLAPSWVLGAAISGAMLYASTDAIPRATSNFRKILFQDFEDMLYKVLKKENEFDGENAPFYISVKDVDERTLIGATFKHRRDKEHPHEYDLNVYAERATIHFDVPNRVVRVKLQDSQTTGNSAKPFVYIVNGQKELQYPMPQEQKYQFEPRVQEMTDLELKVMQDEFRRKVLVERRKQAVEAAMWIASGRIGRVDWPAVGVAYKDFSNWNKKVAELETERQLRRALALGALLFVWVGAPVGVLFARRDFLSAFISCFLPIIVLYYPLTLAGVNLAKEGTSAAHIAFVFAGDIALLAVGVLVARKVKRH